MSANHTLFDFNSPRLALLNFTSRSRAILARFFWGFTYPVRSALLHCSHKLSVFYTWLFPHTGNEKKARVAQNGQSASKWLLSSAYWGGNFFKIANIYLLSFTYGIIYWVSSFLWAQYYNALNGNSVFVLGQVAVWVSLAGVVFSAAEQYLNNTLNMYANDQAYQQQMALSRKINQNIGYLEKAENLEEQMVKSTDSYYTKLHNFCISCVLKSAGIIGNLIFLSRFALHTFTFKIFVCSAAINYAMYYISSSNANPKSISQMKKTADNASNNLRKSISDLGAHYNDYAGNKNLRNWAVFRIKGNTQRLRSLQRGLIASKRLIEFIKTGLGRVVFPLIGIIVAWELKLVFPLAENLTVNQLVDVGLFIQIMQAYMSTWRESVVYLDKQQDLSDANSGFSNMQDLCDIYKVSPKELCTFIDEKSMPSTMSLHIKQALLCFQPAFLTLSILSLSQVAILPIWLSQSLLLPWLAVTISLTATYIITSQKNSPRFDQNIDLNIFSMLSSFIGTSILLGLCRLFSQSIPFLTQITPLQLTVMGLGFFLASSHLVLSLALSSHRQLLTSANSSVEPVSLKKSYPCFSKTTAPNPSSKPIIESAPISYKSVKDLNHIKAENLALSVPEKNTLTKKWELNGEMVFEAGQSNLIIAPNSTGKSSTIRALCEDSQRSQEFFHGTVTLPENHQMFCFHQQNNPLGRLPRFDEKATLHLPTKTVELKPLQLLFLRYVLSDFQNPSQADQWIWKKWDSIREQIVNFLKDKELDFGNLTNDISHGKSSENTWIKLLEKDEIDVGMSGGAVAKLHAAIIYAMLDVYSQLESPYAHKGYKAPFLSVIIDEGFNDVATDNLSALLKKLTTKIKNCPKSTLICILHTDRKNIVQLYDKITLLQSSSTQKSTPHTQSECKQFYTSDEMDNRLDTFHTERVTPRRF